MQDFQVAVSEPMTPEQELSEMDIMKQRMDLIQEQHKFLTSTIDRLDTENKGMRKVIEEMYTMLDSIDEEESDEESDEDSDEEDFHDDLYGDDIPDHLKELSNHQILHEESVDSNIDSNGERVVTKVRKD